MSKIIDVKASEILDSRGNPTVSVKVFTEKGSVGRFDVPSGASTGKREAVELRDNDYRYLGKGVLKAVNNVNTVIRDAVMGEEVSNQKKIDEILTSLDATPNKSNLGANAILGVSVAVLKAASSDAGIPIYKYLNKREAKMPYVMFNILNGGKHASNNVDIQEFMIVPKFNTFEDSLRAASEVFHSLKELLLDKGLSTTVGDEGGYAPDLKSNEEALSIIVKSIETAGYIPGRNIFIALDVAASSFYNSQTDTYNIDNSNLSREELLNYYVEIVQRYPIISIEDPFYEEDYEGFKMITEALGKKISIVGDDLFVTNKDILSKGIKEGLCNAIIIKPNQVGTFYETLETIVMAKQNKYTCVMSHRSGETTDTFISDLAVALNIPFMKSGSISRGERICKYNRLLEIEDEVKNETDFGGDETLE
jgi:enolase